MVFQPMKKPKIKHRSCWYPTDQNFYLLLLEHWSETFTIFTTPDALSPENRQKNLGQLYRAFKRVCTAVDPNFNVHTYMKQQAMWGDNE
jgi:hypothetical protein